MNERTPLQQCSAQMNNKQQLVCSASRVFTRRHVGIQHAHVYSHKDMDVLIEYVSFITVWQNYTCTQQMHDNTWNRNSSQRERKEKESFQK